MTIPSKCDDPVKLCLYLSLIWGRLHQCQNACLLPFFLLVQTLLTVANAYGWKERLTSWVVLDQNTEPFPSSSLLRLQELGDWSRVGRSTMSVCLNRWRGGGPHIVDYIDERNSQVIYILVRLGRSEYKTHIWKVMKVIFTKENAFNLSNHRIRW